MPGWSVGESLGLSVVPVKRRVLQPGCNGGAAHFLMPNAVPKSVAATGLAAPLDSAVSEVTANGYANERLELDLWARYRRRQPLPASINTGRTNQPKSLNLLAPRMVVNRFNALKL